MWNFEFVLQHSVVPDTIHCCFDRLKEKTSCAITKHIPQIMTLGVSFTVACVKQSLYRVPTGLPAKSPFSLCKLLDCGFIQEKDFTSPCLVPVFILLGKSQPFRFVFMAGFKPGFFRRFKRFQVEIINWTSTDSCTKNICAFKKQCRVYFLTGTGWRPNSYFPNQVVIIRACFFGLLLLFLSW